jgi:Tol biopolymer transport system component
MGSVRWSFDCGVDCSLARYPVSWSPDGNEVAFTIQRQDGSSYDYDLYFARTDGSQPTPTLLVAGRARKHGFSPDGRYLAYDEVPATGRHMIQVVDRLTQNTNALTSATDDFYFEAWRPLP